MLDVSLLGSFRIFEDDRPLRLTLPRRGIALLAYVLLHRAGATYRDALAATFWPDVTDHEARGKLRRLLYVVTSGLGEERASRWLSVDASTIGWNAETPLRLDVDTMRTAAREERWHDAVGAYAADLLAGFDDEWIVEERDRLRQQHLVDLERYARALRAERRSEDAIGVVGELLRLEPWREDALRTLVELRVEVGDRAGALAEYERFARRLRDDLDVEPMHETTALYDDIVAGRVASVAPVVRAASAPTTVAPSRGPFVGRDVQLTTLRECFSRAERGRGNVIFVGGESGVGKSRLLEEFAVEGATRGALVLCGLTSFVESEPYQAIAGALRTVAATLGGLGVEATWLWALENVIPGATGAIVQAPPSNDADLERRRLFEAVAVALETLGRAQPVLLLLEDLHAAGSATIALLEYVARRIASARVTIVVTYRDGDVPLSHPLRELRRRFQREGSATSLALGPLEPSDVHALLAASFTNVTPEAARGYYELTEGSPLYLHEFVAPDATRATEAVTLPELPERRVPNGLAATLEDRLAGVSEAARTILEFAAVVGTKFDVELIVAASGLSEVAALDRLDELLDKRIVRDDGRAYGFAHQYYRDVAYARLDAAIRRRRHGRIARTLESLYPQRLDELAAELGGHYEAAGDDARALRYLVRSARVALAVYAHEDAFAFVTRALARAPATEPHVELEALLLREESARRLGRRADQRRDLDRALVLAQSVDDAEMRREVLHRRVALAHALADRDAEKLELETFASAVGEGHSVWRGRLHVAESRFALSVGRYGAARRALESAVDAFAACDDRRGAFFAHLLRSKLERIGGDREAVERSFRAAERQLASIEGNLPLVALLHDGRASYALTEKRIAEADAWARSLLGLAETIGDIESRARAYRFLASAAALRYDVAEAREHGAKALDLFHLLGDRYNAYAVLAGAGILAMQLGHLEEASRYFSQARELASHIDFPFGVASCGINLSVTHQWNAAYERSAAFAKESAEVAAGIDAPSLVAPALVNLGAAQRELGKVAASIVTLEEACRLSLERSVSHAADAFAELALSRARAGLFARSREAVLEAQQRVDEGADTSTYWHWCVGEALLACGNVAEARRVVDEGRKKRDGIAISLSDETSRTAFMRLNHHRALEAIFSDLPSRECGHPDVLTLT